MNGSPESGGGYFRAVSLRYVILVGGEISLLILARWPTAVSRLILSKKDNTMFHGLSAFPLTPLKEGTFDEHAFINLLRPVVDAGVDSLGILGSTGSYAYLTVEERGRIARCAVAHADDIPVIVSIGALRLDDILRLADDAQSAGVSGVLLAPVSYQRLTEDEVFDLYETVTRQLSVPLCIYDNPATTGFSFSDELLFAAAALPNIGP